MIRRGLTRRARREAGMRDATARSTMRRRDMAGVESDLGQKGKQKGIKAVVEDGEEWQ